MRALDSGLLWLLALCGVVAFIGWGVFGFAGVR